MNYCFVTWVTHNSRVSERMVSYNPPDFIEGLRPVVFNYKDQIRVAELIVQGAIKYHLSIITFNVLPDHVHALVSIDSDDELASKIGNIKGYVAHMIRKEQGLSRRIWARKFNRKWIKDDMHYVNVIDYINQNHIKHEQSWGEKMLCGYGEELGELLQKLPGA